MDSPTRRVISDSGVASANSSANLGNDRNRRELTFCILAVDGDCHRSSSHSPPARARSSHSAPSFHTPSITAPNNSPSSHLLLVSRNPSRPRPLPLTSVRSSPGRPMRMGSSVGIGCARFVSLVAALRPATEPLDGGSGRGRGGDLLQGVMSASTWIQQIWFKDVMKRGHSHFRSARLPHFR
jgi:hypothetical protein